jgi:hypothetical protein
MASTLDDLNMQVSAAIYRAEAVPDGPAAEAAFREVSRIEEEIARLVPAQDLEGALARVGAVDAALRSGDWLRATLLAEVFAKDAHDTDLLEQLRALSERAEALALKVVEPQVQPVTFVLSAA